MYLSLLYCVADGSVAGSRSGSTALPPQSADNKEAEEARAASSVKLDDGAEKSMSYTLSLLGFSWRLRIQPYRVAKGVLINYRLGGGKWLLMNNMQNTLDPPPSPPKTIHKDYIVLIFQLFIYFKWLEKDL